MSTVKDQTVKPPYIPLKTFQNSILKLREGGVPNRIDGSVFRGLSNSTIAAIQSAYRFLGLIDDDRLPTERLHQLVDASDSEQVEILKKVLHESYSFLDSSVIDMSRATTQQVETAFREQGISGSTITKAIGFYLAAAKASGVKFSSHIKIPKNPKGNGPARVVKQKIKLGLISDAPIPAQSSIKVEAGQSKTAAEMLLNKFPDFDPSWDEEIKMKWFSSFETLQNAMLKGESR